MLNVGLIGCGHISETYFRSRDYFNNVNITTCADISIEAAKRCALNIISQLKKAINNDFSKIKGCIKLKGFVNSTDEFTDHPAVANGASDLLVSIFGDIGMHTRAATGMGSLPAGVPVEIDMIVDISDDPRF